MSEMDGLDETVSNRDWGPRTGKWRRYGWAVALVVLVLGYLGVALSMGNTTGPKDVNIPVFVGLCVTVIAIALFGDRIANIGAKDDD